jgi:hypothetical protein
LHTGRGFEFSSNTITEPGGGGQRMSPAAARFTASGRFFPRFAHSLQCFGCVAPPPSLLVGVGHDPDSVSSVRSTNGGSGDNVPFNAIPDRGQRPDDSAERAPLIIVEKVGGILCHKHAWLESRNNP